MKSAKQIQQLFQTISFACPPSLEALPGHKLTHRCLTKNNGLNFKLRCNLWDFFFGFRPHKKNPSDKTIPRDHQNPKNKCSLFLETTNQAPPANELHPMRFFLSLYLAFPYGVVLKIGVKPFKLRLGGILVCLRVPDRVPLPRNIFTHRFVVVFSAQPS